MHSIESKQKGMKHLTIRGRNMERMNKGKNTNDEERKTTRKENIIWHLIQ